MAKKSNYSIIVGIDLDTSDINQQLAEAAKGKKISIDSSGLSEASREADRLNNSIGNVNDTTDNAVVAWESLNLIFAKSMELFSAMREQVYELDKAMTELKKHTDLTAEGLDAYVGKLGKIGQEVGRTSAEMVYGADEFRKAGYSMEESLDLSRIAATLQNVADEETSTGEAASFLISQMTAFNLEAEDATHIIDGVNEVAARFAVSTGNLTKALPLVSAALATGNNEWEEMIGLMTGAVEITRNTSKAARGLVSIQSRLNQVVDETSSTGQKLTQWYEEHNIAIYDQEGQLRSLYDILTDVSKIWGTLTTNEKDFYLNQQAGANQTIQLASILSNFDHVVEATAVAYNSAGSAARQNTVYMESLEAQTNLLKAQFEDLSVNVLSKELLGSLTKLGTTGLELLNNNIGTSIIQVGGLTIAGLALAKMLKMAIIPALKGMFALLGPLGLAIVAVTTAVVALAKASKDASPSIEKAEADIQEYNQQIEINKERLEEISKIPWYERTPEILSERAALEAENAELEKNIQLRKQQEVKAAQSAIAGTSLWTDTTKYQVATLANYDQSVIVSSLEEAAEAVGLTMDELSEAVLSGEAFLESFTSTVQYTGEEMENELITAMQHWQRELEQTGKLSDSTISEQGKYLAVIAELLKAYDVLIDAGVELTDNQKAIIAAYKQYSFAVDKATIKTEQITIASDGLADSLLEQSKAHYTNINRLKELIAQYPLLSNAISVSNGEVSTNASMFGVLANMEENAKNEIINLITQETIFNNHSLDISQKVVALRTLAVEAKMTGAAIIGAIGLAGDVSSQIGGLSNAARAAYAEAIAQGYSQAEAAQMAMTTDVFAGLDTTWEKEKPTGGGTTGGGGKQEAKDEKLEALKSVVALRKSELDLLEKEGASEEEQVAKIKEIQDALHEQAEYMRSIGSAQEDINALSASWLDYQKKIDELLEKQIKKHYQEIADELQRQVDAYDVLSSMVQDYADEQIQALQDQIQALQDQNEELDRQIEYEEKLDALARAKQSKVMVYKDGRFQYVQDVDAVSSAKAELDAYNRQRERDKEIKSLQDQIKIYEDYKQQWANLGKNYEREQNKRLALEQLGIDAENANWDAMLKNAQAFVDKYTELMKKAAQASALATGVEPGQASGVDWSELWWEAENDPNLSPEMKKAYQDYYHAQKTIEMEGTGATYDPVTGSWIGGKMATDLLPGGSGAGTVADIPLGNLSSIYGARQVPAINNNLGSISGKGKMDVTIQSLTLPNVKDGNDFVDYVKSNMFGKVMSFVNS